MTLGRVLLSRRQVLVALTTAASIATSVIADDGEPLKNPSVSPSGATALEPSVRVDGSVTNRCNSEDWATRFETSVPVILKFENIRQDTLVTVEWDERLYVFSPTAVVLTASKYVELSGKSAGANQLHFTVPAQTDRLFLQPAALELYPAENVGNPLMSSVLLNNAPAYTASTVAVHASPWGAEIRAAWSTARGYSYPSLVDVLSTGPEPIPAGTKVVIETYRSVATLSTQSADGESVDVESTAVNEFREVVSTIEQDVAAGETFTLHVAPEQEVDDTSRASLTQVGAIYLRPIGDRTDDMRATGRYSVAAITSSGTELTDNRVVEKA